MTGIGASWVAPRLEDYPDRLSLDSLDSSQARGRADT